MALISYMNVQDGEKYNIHQQTGGLVDLAVIMNTNKREDRTGKKKRLQVSLSYRQSRCCIIESHLFFGFRC